MRESRIPSYDPGFRSPLYPWTQVFGIMVSVVLIAYMGWLAVAFTAAGTALCLVWYYWYARSRVVRDGAIYHWFQRLGQRQYGGLDPEFRSILKEKGLRADDPFDQVVARAHVIDADDEASVDDLLLKASDLLSTRLSVDSATLERGFRKGTRAGATPVAGGAALPHLRLLEIDQPELVLVRSRTALSIERVDSLGEERSVTSVHALFFLVSPEGDPGQHLRMLAQIATRVDGIGFLDRWLDAPDGAELRALLLSEAYLHVRLRRGEGTADLIGRTLRDLELPEVCLVAAIHRDDALIVPRGNVVLQENDRLTILGDGPTLTRLRERYGL
jgi:mannitol/fructose-specific phosphotransferase system IIA component (Ntr-type)